MELQAWQQQVIDDKADLDQRLERLDAFLAWPEMPNTVASQHHIHLLQMQRQRMAALSSVLTQRIELIVNGDPSNGMGKGTIRKFSVDGSGTPRQD